MSKYLASRFLSLSKLLLTDLHDLLEEPGISNSVSKCQFQFQCVPLCYPRIHQRMALFRFGTNGLGKYLLWLLPLPFFRTPNKFEAREQSQRAEISKLCLSFLRSLRGFYLSPELVTWHLFMHLHKQVPTLHIFM